MCDCDFASMSFFILLPQMFVLFNFMRLPEIEYASKILFPVRLLFVMITFDFSLMNKRYLILLRSNFISDNFTLLSSTLQSVAVNLFSINITFLKQREDLLACKKIRNEFPTIFISSI